MEFHKENDKMREMVFSKILIINKNKVFLFSKCLLSTDNDQDLQKRETQHLTKNSKHGNPIIPRLKTLICPTIYLKLDSR